MASNPYTAGFALVGTDTGAGLCARIPWFLGFTAVLTNYIEFGGGVTYWIRSDTSPTWSKGTLPRLDPSKNFPYGYTIIPNV